MVSNLACDRQFCQIIELHLATVDTTLQEERREHLPPHALYASFMIHKHFHNMKYSSVFIKDFSN